jgi:hypothetical protein
MQQQYRIGRSSHDKKWNIRRGFQEIPELSLPVPLERLYENK